MYLASITVILDDGEQQVVKVVGETEDEAAAFLGDAATGINVASVVHGTFTVTEVFDITPTEDEHE